MAREMRPNWQEMILIGTPCPTQVVEPLSGKEALDLAMRMFDLTNVKVIHSKVTDTKVQHDSYSPLTVFPSEWTDTTSQLFCCEGLR